MNQALIVLAIVVGALVSMVVLFLLAVPILKFLLWYMDKFFQTDHKNESTH